MKNIVIKTTDLTKEFKDKLAVNKINIEIYEGEIFGILGPNGAGKTTFLKMLSTILPISSGSAYVFGHNVQKNGNDVRKLIGLTGQYASIDEKLTAMENMVIFGQLNGLKKKEAKVRAEELLTQFSLYDVRNKSIKSFSGGMRRRCDLAVGLIMKPKLVFLDEPTTGLDPRTRGEMWQVIRDLAKSGSTIVLTTQYLEEADQLADRIGIIDDGKLVKIGTADELKNDLSKTQLEIQFADDKQIESAINIISEITSLDVTKLPEQKSVSFIVEEVDTTIKVLAKLKEREFKIAEFAIRKPSLDEVFLHVTAKEKNE